MWSMHSGRRNASKTMKAGLSVGEAKQQIRQAAVVHRFAEIGKSVYEFQLTARKDCN